MTRAWLLMCLGFLVVAAVSWAQHARRVAPKPSPAPTTPASPAEALPMSSKTYAKPTKDDLKKNLTPEQYRVTCENGTERAFENAYWDNHEPGLYVDVTTGEPLFSSLDKFDSGSGWPSFTKPLEKKNITEHHDRTYGMDRVEVRSTSGDAHLGHLFDDGPRDRGGMRYCINSASLRFVPVAKLESEGYGEYLSLFGQKPTASSQPTAKPTETTYLAGGCFWGMEDLLRKIPGVLQTEAGYTGGHLQNPTYDDTHDSKSGHAEAVKVVFDPSVLSYEQLLGWFFRMHDPTTLNRQGNDVGTQYRSAIFVFDENQKKVAEAVKARVNSSGKWKKPVVTEIAPASTWWRAEDDHQDYLVRNPNGYTCHFLRD